MISRMNLRDIANDFRKGIAIFPDSQYKNLIGSVGENLFYLMPTSITKNTLFLSVYFHAKKHTILLLDVNDLDKPFMSLKLKKHDILSVVYYHTPLIWYRFQMGIATGGVDVFRIVRDTRKSEPVTSFVDHVNVTDLRDYDKIIDSENSQGE